MSDPERERVAWHEAGHSLVTWAVGWTPTGATVRGGSALAGCAPYRDQRPSLPGPDVGLPLSLWPAKWREWTERSALVFAAGDEAESLALRLGRTRGVPVAELAAELAGELAGGDEARDAELAHPLADEDRAALRAKMDDAAAESDADHLAQLAWLAHGSDLLSQGRWLAYIDEQARSVLLAYAGRLERLAALYASLGEVSGEAIAACLRERP